MSSEIEVFEKAICNEQSPTKVVDLYKAWLRNDLKDLNRSNNPTLEPVALAEEFERNVEEVYSRHIKAFMKAKAPNEDLDPVNPVHASKILKLICS